MKDNIFKTLRNEKNLTIVGLAKEFDKMKFPLDRQTIGRIEKETQSPSAEILKAYCKYFNVTSDYLLGLNPSRKKDISYSSIGEFLGLSDKSIDTIKDLKDDEDLHVMHNFLNKLLENDRVFHAVLWNFFLYVHSQDIYPYLKTNEHDDITPINQDDLIYFIETPKLFEGYFRLDDKIYESLAERQLLDFLYEFKQDYYNDKEE